MKWGYLYSPFNVSGACTWYVKKYGRFPDVVVVHPSDVERLRITPPDKIYIEGHELTVMSWERMIKGFVGLACASVVEPDSEVVKAFISHAEKVVK